MHYLEDFQDFTSDNVFGYSMIRRLGAISDACLVHHELTLCAHAKPYLGRTNRISNVTLSHTPHFRFRRQVVCYLAAHGRRRNDVDYVGYHCSLRRTFSSWTHLPIGPGSLRVSRLMFGPSVTRLFHEVKRSCRICQYTRRRSAWARSTYPDSRQYYRTMMCMKQRHRRRVHIDIRRLLQGRSLSLRRLRSSSSSTRG